MPERDDEPRLGARISTAQPNTRLVRTLPCNQKNSIYKFLKMGTICRQSLFKSCFSLLPYKGQCQKEALGVQINTAQRDFVEADMNKCICHYTRLSSAGQQGLPILYAFSLYREGNKHLKRNWGVEMLSQCWIAGSLLFATEHLIKNFLGDFWAFKDQQSNPTLLGCFIFGALQY